MPSIGLGRLGLWWQFQSHRQPAGPVHLPVHDGPTLLVHVSDRGKAAAGGVLRRLRASRRNLRIIEIGQDGIPDPAENLELADALIAASNAGTLLLLGAALPPALITAAHRRHLPIILGEAHFEQQDLDWSLRSSRRRALLRQVQQILVTDPNSQSRAIRMGVEASRVTMTGPVAEILEPLNYHEADRAAIALLMGGRHAWLAASLPEDEEDAVIAAHHAALHHSHRALLFLAPRDPDRLDILTERIEAEGLIVARRTLDEDPTDEIQVMLTDGPTEMGLWYRLSPVTYLGGTLNGDDSGARHPFEPAALGSAIVHGPHKGRHPTAWRQLDGAGAAREVRSAEDLAATIAELSQPDLVAARASNAWSVSTGGADVTIRICAPVLVALDGVTS
jgi:3-deoxy-D-manno-octulosonic-acid transferase